METIRPRWCCCGRRRAQAPRDAEVQNRLGEALDRIGALDAAIDAYQRAVAARPDFVVADNNLTLALAKAGRGREAVERRAGARDGRARRTSIGCSRSAWRSRSRTWTRR